jgi:Neuraminidase (sialidase)
MKNTFSLLIKRKLSGVSNSLLQLNEKIKILIICLLILLGPISKVFCQGRETNEGNTTVLKLLAGPNNPRNSEGDFITLKDGRILYVYTHYTGNSDGDNDPAYLAGRYSSDKGESWTKEDVTIVEQEGKMNVMSVSLLRLQNGEIALFYLRKNSETDCIPMVRISKDETKTWSDPKPCITDREGYFVLNNDRVIQLANGRVILSVALHQTPDDQKMSRIGRIWSYYSDDNGRSWKSSAEVANPDSVVTQEPGLVELKNGNILMFMRTTKGVQYFSFSKDKGETWSAVEPSNIPSPCSPATIVRVPSTGDLILVWNDNGINQKRTPFNIAVSKDEGKTWINKKVVENNPAGIYCYPATLFTGGNVLLAYLDAHTRGITIKKISSNWIYK